MQKDNLARTVTFVVFSIVSLILAYLVNDVVFLPYMDEIFHIPQVQRYCQGNFVQWDPKITTPPGLYLMTIGLLKPLISYFPNVFSCDVLDLRSINLAFAFGNFYLCSTLLNTSNQDNKMTRGWCSAVSALTICTFPPLYFFTFLYYTDPGSTFAVLLMYQLALHERHFFAAIIGAFSILFRQTNIVWVAFCGMLAVIDIFEKYKSKAVKKVDISSWKYAKVTLQEILQLSLGRKRESFQAMWDFVAYCGGYISIGVGFLVFMIWNKGIVLGDRDAHKATIHIPQIFYFSAFTLIFAFPIFVFDGLMQSILIFAKRHLRFMSVLVLLFFLIIATNSLAHPYILADNRHYPFYLWRKLLNRNTWSRFFALPVYLYACAAILELLRIHRGILWTMAYCLCLFAAIVPQELLEFRYFIVPYLIFRLNMPPTMRVHHIAFEFLLTFLVNCWTLHMFLMRPFVSPNEEVLQRFIW